MVYDYVVVGGGIGGVVSYAILKKLGKSAVLIEKMDYLGGCAGTFKKDGMFYNAGASTLVGADDNMPLGVVLRLLEIEKKSLPIKPIDPSIVVYVKDKKIERLKDFEASIDQINRVFYHKSNKALWHKIYKTAMLNWEYIYRLLPFNPKNPKLIFKNLVKNPEYFIKNSLNTFVSAKSVIRYYLGNIPKEYIDFLNSQILMTAQGYWDEVNFSFASMGLTYTNLDNYYVLGGMNKVLEFLVKNDENVKLKTKAKKISKQKDVFVVKTNRGDIETKKLILNKTIWDFCELLDEDLKNDFCTKSQKTYNKIWSSATLYFYVKDKDFILNKHHYQVLHELNPYTGSYSFFVSVSDKDDEIEGKRSVTISTHCKIELWENLSKEEYDTKKERLKDFIMKTLLEKVEEFQKVSISDIMVGTPLTFKRYTDRYRGSVGGTPLIMDYTPFRYPMGITPIKDLYLVGDSVFPGQGYPGVIVGVFNLLLQIEPIFKDLADKIFQ